MNKKILIGAVIVVLIVLYMQNEMPKEYKKGAASPTLYISQNSATGGRIMSSPGRWVAQTFTPSSFILSSVKVQLRRSGSPIGTLNVHIQNTDVMGKPTGSYLSSNIDIIDLVSLSTSSSVIEVSMQPYLFEANKKYAMVVEAPSQADSNNYITIYYQNPGSYSGGDYLLSSDSGGTWTPYTYDLVFEIWGTAMEYVQFRTNDLSYDCSYSHLIAVNTNCEQELIKYYCDEAITEIPNCEEQIYNPFTGEYVFNYVMTLPGSIPGYTDAPRLYKSKYEIIGKGYYYILCVDRVDGTSYLNTYIDYTYAPPQWSGYISSSELSIDSAYEAKLDGDTCNQVVCSTDADTNCNGDVSDSELLAYINLWLSGSVTDAKLLQAAQAWLI